MKGESRLGRDRAFRFALVLLGFALVVFVFYRESVAGRLTGDLDRATAQAVAALLRPVVPDLLRQGNVLSEPGGFSYRITYECSGLLPVAGLMVGILAFPIGSRRQKGIGLLLGLPMVLLFNAARLTHLFVVGASRPELFDLLHGPVWDGLFFVAELGLWLLWISWVTDPPAGRSSPTMDRRERGCAA